MTYIIEAQKKDGSYMKIKNDTTSNLLYAILRAKEMIKLFEVSFSDICTIEGKIIRHFVSKSNLV